MSRKTSLIGCIVGLALVAGTATTGRGGLISTEWDNSSNVGNFNRDSAYTWGQTFTVSGEDTFLEDFTFWLDDDGIVSFKAYVAEWTGTRAGNVLWTSNVENSTEGSGFSAYEFQPNILLSNAVYVAFVSTLDAPPSTGLGIFGATSTNNYTEGAFFLSYASTLGDLFTQNWTNGYSDLEMYDLAFTANLKSPTPAIPEPSSLAVLTIVCVCATVGHARRRLKARQPSD